MAQYLPVISSSSARSRPASPRFQPDPDDTEFSSDDATSSRIAYSVPTHYRHQPHPNHLIFAHATNSASNITSAYQTPTHSRPSSPAPRGSGAAYFFSDDDQPYRALLGRASTSSRTTGHRKWSSDSTPAADSRRSHRRRTSGSRVHGCRRVLQVIVRSPFFPAQPATILLSVTIVLIVALSITLFLMYLLNPDKAPLPWRSYCATEPPFPAEELKQYPPVGVFLGVMSTDTAVERRMLIRSTWASHMRSRGTDGSTDRTVVRFILGIPQKDWARRIQLEAESYKDIIVLDVPENMNNGKTHAYMVWANEHALVPPPSAVHPHSHKLRNQTLDFLSPYPDTGSPYTTATQREHFPSFAANHHAAAPALAPHDPQLHHDDEMGESHTQADWVRPQFVIKADDDAFVMLSELEARLRLEWYNALKDSNTPSRPVVGEPLAEFAGLPVTKSPVQLPGKSTTQVLKQSPQTSTITPSPHWPEEDHNIPRNVDPMIYWGYLVKARFMAGELYALSSALVDYVATTPTIRHMTRGAEDKLTARWIRMHPRAADVRWRSEHCWVYDHPRAGTVYSHGFLFPSEVSRIRDEVTKGLTPGQLHLLPSTSTTVTGSIRTGEYSNPADADPSLTHSTVSRFGKHYTPPASNLTTEQEVEALIEGSPLSKLRDETVGGNTGEATPREVESAWRRRESRRMRTLGLAAAASATGTGSVPDEGAFGGTVVVHYIKRNEWFFETALAFLEDENDPPPLEGDEHLDFEDDASSAGGRPGKSGSNRIESDLNGKNPIDFSNLDPEPVPEPPKKSGSSSHSHVQTDFNSKRPLDISHLDGVDDEAVEEPTADDALVEEPAVEEVEVVTDAETIPILDKEPSIDDNLSIPVSDDDSLVVNGTQEIGEEALPVNPVDS